MKCTVLLLALAALSGTASAAETTATFRWDPSHPPGGATVRPAGKGDEADLLEVQGAKEGKTILLLEIENPKITTSRYALEGNIRYSGVKGKGYLELWNIFPNQGRYFSRTMAERGPLQAITGDSDWRSFIVPFTNEPGAPPPVKLEFNLVLPGEGRVILGPVALRQFGDGEPFTMATNGWWEDQTGGWIGAIAGSLIGILGAVVGTLSSIGRGRRVALGLLLFAIAVGVACLAVGALALLAGQPYGVYYPFLLSGTIAAAVPIGIFKSVIRRFEAIELRRIQAADA